LFRLMRRGFQQTCDCIKCVSYAILSLILVMHVRFYQLQIIRDSNMETDFFSSKFWVFAVSKIQSISFIHICNC